MPEGFTSSTGRSQSQASRLALADTQLIGTVSIDASQSSRVKQIKILDSNEDNRVVDSSCDFKDSIDTQQLLDHEPDTVVIPEGPRSVPTVESSGKSQMQDKKSQDSQGFFKHLKLPDSESPWLNHIKDPFDDTPMANKISLLGETPVNRRMRNPFEDTPVTLRKNRPLVNAALNTPSGREAHKIFNKLREDQADQPELEVDTQPIPSLAFDSQIGQTPTQNFQDANLDVVKLPERFDIEDDDEEERPDISHITSDEEEQTTVGEDTLADPPGVNDNTTFDVTHNYEPTSPDASQAALQIPGTVPDEEDASLLNGTFNKDSSPVVSEDEEANKNDSSEARHYEFNAEDSIQITHNRDIAERPLQDSSPGNDSAVFRFPKSAVLIHNSPMMNTPRVAGHSMSMRPDFGSQMLTSETPSRPTHSKSDILPLGFADKAISSPKLLLGNNSEGDDTMPEESDTVGDSALADTVVVDTSAQRVGSTESSKTGAMSAEDSETGKPDEEVTGSTEKNGSQFDLVANITQELSDIDDESKVDATIDEENPSSKFTAMGDEEEESTIFGPRRTRRKRHILAVSSPGQKRQKGSPIKRISQDSLHTIEESVPFVPEGDITKTEESEEEKEEEASYNDRKMMDAREVAEAIELPPFSEPTPQQEDIGMSQEHFNEAHDYSHVGENTADIVEGDTTIPLPNGTLRVDELVLTDQDVVSKNSVWHLYETYFYPGLVVGAENGQPLVKFKDRTQGATGLFPLDIRVGDTVTHDDVEYKVVGLDCVADGDESVIRCMRGFDTVICQKIIIKKNSKSRKKQKGSIDGNKELRFPLADIKMAESYWLLTDRVGSDQEVRRRSTQNKPTVTFENELIQGFVKVPVYDSSLVFSGCLFTLTGLEEGIKNDLEDKIKSHGGAIADNGFESYMREEGGCLKQLDRALTTFKFAALITGKPSRYPKYFEALALRWPVLSYEFVDHCLEEGVLLQNLHTYLLPSGVSKTLHGAVKSADIHTFVTNWRNGFDLSLQLSNNRILAGRSVLVVDVNPPVAEFLFHALGCRSHHIKLINNSKLVGDCATAMRGGSGDPVYIYGRKKGTLQKVLKSFESGKKSVVKRMMGTKSMQKLELEIIDWDWLVECIVSGHPWKSTRMKIAP